MILCSVFSFLLRKNRLHWRRITSQRRFERQITYQEQSVRRLIAAVLPKLVP